jgi:hypothetical protein
VSRFAGCLALCLSAVAFASGQELHDFTPPGSIAPGTTIVIGFLGGFDRWNDRHRSIRRVADRINQLSGVHAETASNHRRATALRWLKLALDSDHDGILSNDERESARVILYGQSLGGGAAVETARELERLGVPVLLTVQVDSVGVHDDLIPSNVREAVNFFQHDLLTFQGQREIRAKDPARTNILGNYQMSYLFTPVDQSDSTWIRRTFGGSHAKMEADPVLWKQVEAFITYAVLKDAILAR